MAKRSLSRPIQLQKDLIGPQTLRVQFAWDGDSFSPERVSLHVLEGTAQDGNFFKLGDHPITIQRKDIPPGIVSAIDTLSNLLLKKVEEGYESER